MRGVTVTVLPAFVTQAYARAAVPEDQVMPGEGGLSDFAHRAMRPRHPKEGPPSWRRTPPVSAQRRDSYVFADVFPISVAYPDFPEPHASVSTALCFSGGGSRSMIITIGALRALEDLGLMSGVDAISAISGGSWAASVYMFAARSKLELLGHSTAPADLTMDVLAKKPAELGATMTSRWKGSNLPYVAKQLLQVKFRMKDFVASTVLEPFELNKPEAFMAGSQRQKERIIRANPQMRNAEFLIPQPRRPKVFVIGGTMMAPAGYEREFGISLQMSPDYTGSPFYPDDRRVAYTTLADELQHITVGGGLVETFAFGGDPPLEEKRRRTDEFIKLPAPASPFTLADAIGISSTLTPPLNPARYKIWPVFDAPASRPSRSSVAMEFPLADGGQLEETGIIAMLQRKAKRIVCFVNTDQSMSRSVDFCERARENELGWDPAGVLVHRSLTDKFGYGTDMLEDQFFLSKNQVFAKKDLPPLLCELQKLRNAGKAAVYRTKHTVVQNRWWGIQGGDTVDVVYVYNDQFSDFEQMLPADTQAELAKSRSTSKGAFANFPFYKTVFQNFPHVISLTNAQVNLLAAQAEFAIHENADLFHDLLGKPGTSLPFRKPGNAAKQESVEMELEAARANENEEKNALEYEEEAGQATEEASLAAEEVNVTEAGEVVSKAEDDAKAAAVAEASFKAEEEARIEAEEAKAQAANEARIEVEEEAKAKAIEEARAKAEKEAMVKAAEEERIRSEEAAEEDRIKAAEDARIKAEEEAWRRAAEAQAKAEEEARIEAEEVIAKEKAAEKARIKAKEEANIKAAEEARIKIAEEAKIKAEEDAMAGEEAMANEEEKAEFEAEEVIADARIIAEEEAKIKAAAAEKAAEEARIKAEEEAKISAAEEDRISIESEATEEARIKIEEKAKIEKAEEARLKTEARLRAEEEAAEASINAKEEARINPAEEARIKAQEDAKSKAEEEEMANALETAKAVTGEEVEKEIVEAGTQKDVFTIGERVQRRSKKDEEWGYGYVKSLNPLEVTVLDKADADSCCTWDEVRKAKFASESPAQGQLQDDPVNGPPLLLAADLHRHRLHAVRIREAIAVCTGTVLAMAVVSLFERRRKALTMADEPLLAG